ncbi:hypothetical protein ACFWIA_20620 [Streptomyces sp. NPDC127068]|uniref:hypothetical protein n=1 Tax=Streptomyces sp. NPDC127068 TaxID=3347127 RepID=UPI0036605BA9
MDGHGRSAESLPGTDPDRYGFTIAFQTTHEQVFQAAGIIGRRVLAGLLPADDSE